MTSAFIGSDGHTDRFPTEPDERDADRTRIIAAIHGLAVWLHENPDIPAPWGVSLFASAGPTRLSDTERVAILDGFAGIHQAARYALKGSSSALHEYAKITMPTVGTDMTYCLSTTVTDPEKQPAGSDVPARGCVAPQLHPNTVPGRHDFSPGCCDRGPESPVHFGYQDVA